MLIQGLVSFCPVLSPSVRVLDGEERTDDYGRFSWSRLGRLQITADHIPLTRHGQMITTPAREAGKYSLRLSPEQRGNWFQ